MTRKVRWGLAGMVLMLAGCWRGCGGVAPMRPEMVGGEVRGLYDPSNVLRQPPEKRSEGGVLSTTLTARYAERALPGGQAWLRSYDGLPVAPTWRVSPGDVLDITLVNELPATTASAPGVGDHMGHTAGAKVTPPHGFNVTNLHTHGLWVSPIGRSDNVAVAIHPGESYQYESIIPEEHSPGTHWYHPHHHGSVALQVASGMAGMLIVSGGLDEVPEIAAAKEQVIVFQQIAADPGDCADEDGQTVLPSAEEPVVGCVESYGGFAPGRWARADVPTTLNGQVLPVIEMRPGELQRWRMVHAGVRESLDLALYPSDALGLLPRLPLLGEQARRFVTDEDRRLPLQIIAEDGIAYGRMEEVRTATLEPGYRVDMLVQAPQAGLYALIDESRPAGLGLHPEDEVGQLVTEPTRVLGWVRVAGPRHDMALPSPDALRCLAPYPHVEDEEITGCQATTFMVGPGIFTVNGEVHSPEQVSCKLPLGEAQEWHLRSLVAAHPYHIHVNPFEVLRPGRLPVWKDTLVVRADQTRDTDDPPVVIRSRYRRYTGAFVMHCHILDHEDQGMMQAMEVMEDAPPPGPSAETSCVASTLSCPLPMDPGPDLSAEVERAACPAP